MRIAFHCLVIGLAGILPTFGQIPPLYGARSGSPSNAGMTPAPIAVAAAPAAGSPGDVSVPINGYVADETYKLRAGDTVSFQILEDRLLDLQAAPVSLVVADSGELDVPYIGRVTVVDKTCKEISTEIEAVLEKEYYKKATVVISLNLANRLWGRVYIMGQIKGQGVLDVALNENLTVGKAILRAGGFADFANKSKVKVVRANSNGRSQTFDLDMQQILEEGKIDKDITLQPNDLIIVPSRLINF